MRLPSHQNAKFINSPFNNDHKKSDQFQYGSEKVKVNCSLTNGDFLNFPPIICISQPPPLGFLMHIRSECIEILISNFSQKLAVTSEYTKLERTISIGSINCKFFLKYERKRFCLIEIYFRYRPMVVSEIIFFFSEHPEWKCGGVEGSTNRNWQLNFKLWPQ